MFQKVAASAELITLPDIYFRLKELISDPEYTMAEVALLVGRDPGMAARFLRFVNSPLNRRACRIETVNHAVSFLGIRQVHDLVLGASVAEAFKGIKTEAMNMRKFWRRSFYCAMMAKRLGGEYGIKESNRLFVTGLLHDLGHLFMYIAIPQESQQAVSKAKKLRQPLHQVERELFGFDYARMGGHMLRKWYLPKSLQTIIWLHPEPGKADQFPVETALMHISVLLVRSDLENGLFGEGEFAVDPVAWEATRLTADQCLGLRKAAADQVGEVADSLFF
jgi:HD-like signal output (HDOD) protein